MPDDNAHPHPGHTPSDDQSGGGPGNSPDDTSGDAERAARHGDGDASPEESVDEAVPISEDHAFFMRPGSAPAASAADSPTSDSADDPETITTTAALGTSDDPVDHDEVDPDPDAPDDSDSAAEPAGDGAETPVVGAASNRKPRFTPLMWVAAAVILAVVVFSIALVSTRKDPTVVTASVSPTPSATPLVDTSDLLSPAAAKPMDPEQTWSVVTTLDRLAKDSPQVACLVDLPTAPNSVMTKQRTLRTGAATGLAALQQIDGYDSVADAERVFTLRAQSFSRCNDVPTWIESAAGIRELGDQATAVTIVYEEPTPEFHTVLMVRTGTVIDLFDVAQNDSAVAISSVAAAASTVVAAQCERADGSCAVKPAVIPAVPPKAGTPGWMVESDLPRITPGAGAWVATETSNIDTTGSGCENLSLASVSGPTTRKQRTYLLTQDDAAPQDYGLDQINFTFANATAAKAFATKLNTNIAKCASRQTTASVSERAAVSGTGAGNQAIAGSSNLVTQKAGGSKTVLFRVGAASVGNHVVYVISNPTKGFGYPAKTFSQVVLRAAQRASQVR